MGSEGPKNVTIHVTGFKKFQGVPENPTQKIVSNLKEYVAKRGLSAASNLGTCTVLEAAGEGAQLALHKTLEAGVLDQDGSNNEVIWLHLGVNSGAQKFAIERQAINEATFRCPDQFGWQPQQVPVVPDDGSTSKTRRTNCCVEAILRLMKRKGFDVIISDDAGRFVCNYAYYYSLRYAQQKGHKSLFVHVPLFSTIDEDTQMLFVASLLEAIVASC